MGKSFVPLAAEAEPITDPQAPCLSLPRTASSSVYQSDPGTEKLRVELFAVSKGLPNAATEGVSTVTPSSLEATVHTPGTAVCSEEDIHRGHKTLRHNPRGFQHFHVKAGHSAPKPTLWRACF